MANAVNRKYGLIGAGMMGQEHVRSLQLVPGAELVCVADPHEGSRNWTALTLEQIKASANIYSDWQEMIDKEQLDAVLVATPNHTHHAIVTELFETELAIMVEKPLCTTLEDAYDLHTHAMTRQAITDVGLEYRYMPPVTRFIERAHNGEAGPLRALSIREHRFPFLDKIGDWNRFNRNTGGTLVEKCCHFFDLMRYILGQEAVRVFASAGQDVNHLDERYDGVQPDILDNAFVIVDFDGGARAVLDLCMFAEGSKEQEEIVVVGDTAKLEVALPSGMVVHSPRDKSGPFEEHVPVSPEILAAGHHHGATVYHLRAFHEALVSGAPAPVTTLDGLKSVEIGLAAQQSAARGEAVSLPLVG
ncbi:MAG: Gfo/Idh/MocA family oxidoreductase [Pseudomonadota bacterium]